ncbi:Anti-sigma regulatory factor (Ser/Thr protein kinase) [Variovorax sp. HW608]|uniref:ATP-binding protein n=1 Tax=Variovorax sp. HW608 TaxID=1034889 RepID=UPI00081FB337|nr:ATP-binding protein [Variovorax sp. HW608]SCK46439.1 Anti-sigma regulatory factor (Ser/Thr protein kinase) [Variovorax sp. HW608]
MAQAGGEPRASLIVDNALCELPRISAWVHDWAEYQHLPERVAHNLDLCSTEVVTNIMTHAVGDSAQSILLRLGWQGDEVVLEVVDEGSEFDLRQVPEPARPTSLRDARVGGWGIPMVRHFSDGVRYRHEGGRNRLTLLFRAAAPP